MGIGGSTIETTLPMVNALSTGSSAVAKDGSNLVITVNNVRDAYNACQPASFTASQNVAGLFEVQIVIPNAVAANGDVMAGLYDGVTATYRITDDGCASVAPQGTVQANAEVDLVGDSFSGAAAIDISGATVGRIVTTFVAPTCDLPPSSAAGACVALPSCGSGAGGVCM